MRNKACGHLAVHSNDFKERNRQAICADKMDMQHLCVRFGWAVSSDMSEVFISRVNVEGVALQSGVGTPGEG